VGEEEPILDEVMDNLKEAAQRIRATQNRLRAAIGAAEWWYTQPIRKPEAWRSPPGGGASSVSNSA
jgi:hypothetical protein